MITVKFLKISLISITAMLLGGCNHFFDQAKPDDPAYAPVPPASYTPPPSKSGAIYQAGYEVSLFQDIKARRVGDTLTVVLQEKTDGKKNANTKMNRDSKVNIQNPTILGATPAFSMPAAIPLAAVDSTYDFSFGLESSSDFSGDGSSTQNNQLSGNITVTVVNVLGNGNLVVRGEKWITLNKGDEYIRLTGIVRQADVNADNTVPSYKVGNARITYAGTGQVAESNNAGWLTRFFDGAFNGIFPF